MKMGAGRTDSFTENLIRLADAALDYLQQNRGVLEILRRGGRMPKLSREDPLWRSLMRDLKQSEGGELAGKSEEVFRILYCLLTMGGSVAAAAILRGEPEPMEKIKPALYGIIRAALAE